MKKNIINLILSVFVFASIISISNLALALTADDISMLLKAGIITPPQASILNKSISVSPNIVQVTAADYQQSTDCANISIDITFAQKDTPSNGSAVSILQNFLNKNNYLTVGPTGYFGGMTLSAVKAFQTANGINPTGYVGPLTRNKIKELDCNKINTVTTSDTTSSVQTTIKPGSSAPTITLSAKPTQVMLGEATTLTWDSTNAVDQCKITSKDSDGKILNSVIDASGVKSTGPINKSTTYTVICYNKYGIPGSKSLLVEAIDPTKISAQQNTYTNYVQAASITSINPSSGNRGDIVAINGSGFLSSNEVFFDGGKIDNSLILSQSSSSISFKVPEYKSCLSANCLLPNDTSVETGGKKIIQVSNINGFSNDFTFTLPSKIIVIAGTPTVTPYTPPKPILSYIQPVSGNRGDTVTISGLSFSTDSIVFFGGFKVAENLIVSRNNNSILFTVPPFQMGCTDPDYEVCPRLPLPGTGLIIETGGQKDVYVMSATTKSTSTSATFTLPSKKISY